jgi:hypothetical protein
MTLPGGEELWSPAHRALNAKAAEQAAAAALLAELAARDLKTGAERDKPSPIPKLGTVAQEPRAALHELRQRERIQDFAIAVDQVEGPGHAPLFHLSGFVVRLSGERLDVAGITAPSKREGERLVALRLLESIQESVARSRTTAPTDGRR